MSTRIGNSRIVTPTEVDMERMRFEWFDDGHAEVRNDNDLVLRVWPAPTVLEQRSTRESKLWTPEGEWLATITTGGCNCGG